MSIDSRFKLSWFINIFISLVIIFGQGRHWQIDECVRELNAMGYAVMIQEKAPPQSMTQGEDRGVPAALRQGGRSSY